MDISPRSSASTRWSSATSTRSARRRDGDGPGADGLGRACRGLPGRLRPPGGPGARARRNSTAKNGASAAASASAACGTAAATPRCPIPRPSRSGSTRKGRLTLYNGAVDIGQGSNTVMAQIAADALGWPGAASRTRAATPTLTADAGKTSASRQTFVSGKAAELAGRDLRQQILRLANAGEDARDGPARRPPLGATTASPCASRPRPAEDAWRRFAAAGHLRPADHPLDANGQGSPYATYGFAAQIAEVEVDLDLGTVKVLRMVAAHDVGPRSTRRRWRGRSTAASRRAWAWR
jgi:CO/xanthine dehydrogenase Mo-binding subunit